MKQERESANKRKGLVRLDCPSIVSPPGPDSDLLLDAAEAIVPKSSSVLDLGTGSGYIAIALKKSGWRKVIASDIDSVAISSARKNFVLNNVKIPLFRSDHLENVPKAKWILFNPPVLGRPAGILSFFRKIPGSFFLAKALSSVFRPLWEKRLESFLLSIPKGSNALVVLPAKSFPKGKRVISDGKYSVFLF